MSLIKNFFTIFVVIFIFMSSSYSQDQIVYLDLDYVVVNSKAGKTILKKLEESKSIALSKFEKKGKELKKIENEIKKQKNIISEDELKKKLIEFRKEVSNYQKNRQKIINDFNKNIFVASKKKNITQEVIKIIDSKIK